MSRIRRWYVLKYLVLKTYYVPLYMYRQVFQSIKDVSRRHCSLFIRLFWVNIFVPCAVVPRGVQWSVSCCVMTMSCTCNFRVYFRSKTSVQVATLFEPHSDRSTRHSGVTGHPAPGHSRHSGHTPHPATPDIRVTPDILDNELSQTTAWTRPTILYESNKRRLQSAVWLNGF